MKVVLQVAGGLLAALLAVVPAVPTFAQQGVGVVYVPTPQKVVDAMLRMAAVGPDDYVIDLGSGDGRMVITAAKSFGARALGVELDRYLLDLSVENAKTAGVAERARFAGENLFETDLSKATVLTSYLLPEMNLKLRPKILALKPGTRVVAHDYHFGDWPPDLRETLEVPEKKVGAAGISYIYLWYVPAQVAGRWTSTVRIGQEDVPVEFALTQRYQTVRGQVRAGGGVTPTLGGTLRGDELLFSADLKGRGQAVRYEFRGRVSGDRIEGTAATVDRGGRRESPWTAQLAERSAVE